MKCEWKKAEKNTYLPESEPTIINIAKCKYLTIKGEGNPNSEDFQKRVEALYSLSYAIRTMPKSGYTPEGYFEYTVYPLEGIWDLNEQGRKLKTLDKNQLVYTIMIKQPDFVNDDVFNKALLKTKTKKQNDLLDKVVFEEKEDGLCVQMMHVGPYDTEAVSFDKIQAFLNLNNLERLDKTHKEIYISDPRKTPADKMKTVLRCFIKKTN